MSPRSFFGPGLPPAANLATAARGVDFDACPPVFEYTSVSRTSRLTLRPLARTWSNSLFEDNAEFGMGFRVSIDKQTEFAHELLRRVAGAVGDDLVSAILNAKQKDESDIYEQRQRVDILKERLHKLNSADAR